MSDYDDPSWPAKVAITTVLIFVLFPVVALVLKYAWNETLAAVFGLPRIDWHVAVLLLSLRLMLLPLR